MDPLTRRVALASLGAIGLGVVGCSDDEPGSASDGSSSGDGSATSTSGPSTSTPSGSTPPDSTPGPEPTASPDCILSPEQTEGPFYLDEELVRSDITEARPGAPLRLTLFVVDADECTPIADAAVDVWHCDAEGAYSGFDQGGGGEGTTFLRGTQVSDATGRVDFATIYPGWYQGRAVHIHVKVHVGGDQVHTGQLYFDDDMTAAVYAATDPYADRGEPEMRNDDDSIYGDGGEQSTLAVTPDGTDHVGSLTLGVRT